MWKQKNLGSLDPNRDYVLRFYLKDADLFAYEINDR